MSEVVGVAFNLEPPPSPVACALLSSLIQERGWHNGRENSVPDTPAPTHVPPKLDLDGRVSCALKDRDRRWTRLGGLLGTNSSPSPGG